MKVQVIRRTDISAKTETTQDAQTSQLPSIDTWYAFQRTIPALYLFPRYDGDTTAMAAELGASLTKTISKFPRLTAALRSSSAPHPIRSGQELQRLQAKDGGASAEFIVATTNARIESLLLPGTVDKSTGYLWERSNTSLGCLSVTQSDTTGIRVQVTSFRCGGFAIAIDADHGLADGYTIGLFMNHWSFEHSGGRSAPPTPVNHIDPVFDSEVDRSIAENLPTLGPHFRGKVPRAPGSQLVKNSPMAPHLLHVPLDEFVRVTRVVQREAGDPSMTQHTAWFGVMWAAVNRTRIAHGLDSTRHVRVARSMRPDLGLPDGTVGSPFLAIIVEADTDMADRSIASELAMLISSTTRQYDREAMLSIAHDAMVRDSPVGPRRLEEPPSHLIFTPGIQPTSIGPIRFGSVESSFMMPLHLPQEGIVMIGNVSDGVDMFFSLPAAHVQTLARDPALSYIQLVSDF